MMFTLREAQAWPVLWRTLASQASLVAVIALIVVLVVQRATQPVRALSAALQTRTQGDLSPLHAPTAARELQPLVQATLYGGGAAGYTDYPALAAATAAST